MVTRPGQAEAATVVAAHPGIQTADGPDIVRQDKVHRHEALQVVIHLVDSHPVVVHPDVVLPAAIHQEGPDQQKILPEGKAQVNPQAVLPVKLNIMPFVCGRFDFILKIKYHGSEKFKYSKHK